MEYILDREAEMENVWQVKVVNCNLMPGIVHHNLIIYLVLPGYRQFSAAGVRATYAIYLM